MTKPIPAWSANLSVNMPKDERLLLGRLAMQRGAKSVGEFVKKLLLLGMEREDQQSAAQLREIRRRYYGAALILIFGLTLCNHEVMRRPARRVRETDDVTIQRFNDLT